MSHPGEHPEEESIFHTPGGRPDQLDLPPSIHHSSGSKTVGHWPGAVDGVPRLGATFINLSQGGPTNVIVKLSSTFINLAQFVSIRFIETGLQLLNVDPRRDIQPIVLDLEK